jgi:hypothetical protein
MMKRTPYTFYIVVDSAGEWIRSIPKISPAHLASVIEALQATVREIESQAAQTSRNSEA